MCEIETEREMAGRMISSRSWLWLLILVTLAGSAVAQPTQASDVSAQLREIASAGLGQVTLTGRAHLPRFARLRGSVGLAVGHGGCGRTRPREGIGAAQCVGQLVPASHAPDQIRRLSAGIPAEVTNSGRTEDPRTTGTGWVAVRNLDLATPITGMPNSACARAPRPGRPAGSRSA